MAGAAGVVGRCPRTRGPACTRSVERDQSGVLRSAVDRHHCGGAGKNQRGGAIPGLALLEVDLSRARSSIPLRRLSKRRPPRPPALDGRLALSHRETRFAGGENYPRTANASTSTRRREPAARARITTVCLPDEGKFTTYTATCASRRAL